MRRRKKKNTRIILAAIIVAFIITTIGIFYTIKKFGGTQNLPSDNTTNNQDSFKGFYIGEKLSMSGNIQIADQIGLYTHTLVFSGGEGVLGLKSRTVDLSSYSGNVMIAGTITDIKNQIPIVDVEDVTSLNENMNETTENTMSGEELTGKQTFFDFPGNGYYVDFFGNTGFNIDIQDESVVISQQVNNGTGSGSGMQSKELGSIYAFSCVSGDSLKDCASLEQKFKQLKFENFVSTNGIKLYKRPESDNWFFTNGNIWGYNLTAKSDSDAIKLSKYIYIYSPTNIKDKISKNISNVCKNQETKMTKISSLNLSNQDDKLVGKLEGTDNNGSKLGCDIEIKLGKNIETNLIEFKIISKADKKALTGTINTGSNMNDTISTGSTNSFTGSSSGEATASVQFSGNVNTGNMLEWDSREGFKVYFPKSVAFKKQVLSGDLNDFEKDLKCTYKINVINYKLKDQLDTNPSMEVYYCNGNISNSSSIPGDTEIKTSLVNGKNVLIRYNDTAAKDVGNKMIVY